MATKRYENEKQFTLRLNEEIYNKIKDFAFEDGRSTAKEIEYILKTYIENRCG